MPVPALLAQHECKGEAGEIVEVPVAHGDEVRRVLLYGIGDGTPRALRKAGAAVARRAKGRAAIEVDLPAGVGDRGWSALAEGALLASYTMRIGASRKKAVEKILFFGPEEAGRAVGRAEVAARATALARDLANTPSNEKDPAWLADAPTRSRGRAGLALQGVGRGELAAEGFGGIARRRAGVGAAAAADRAGVRARAAPARRRRTSCWSARASPSTPAGSRSSRATAWCR